MTDPELKTLLVEFESPQIVGIACKAAFGRCKYFPVPAAMADAKKRCLVIERDEVQIVNSDKVYGCDVILTAAGREFCCLPPLVSQPKYVKKSQPSLF